MTCPQCEKCGSPMRLVHTWGRAPDYLEDWMCDYCEMGVTLPQPAPPSPLQTTITLIHVSERVPDSSRRVFVVGIAGWDIAEYHYETFYDYWGRRDDITHWAELPPPPKPTR